MATSARKALFWASVVEIILICLYVSFCAVDSACGMNWPCVGLYFKRVSYVSANLLLALLGMRIGRKSCRKACFAVFAFLCFGVAVVEAFVCTNYPWWSANLLQPTYMASAALTAALGITSAVAYFFVHHHNDGLLVNEASESDFASEDAGYAPSSYVGASA